jgi:hypothetical protein
MDAMTLKKALPTFSEAIDRWRKKRHNRLPKHLRPPEIWPLWLQIAFNSGLIIALSSMIIDQDDYLSDAGPAIGMVVCFLFLVYTVISSLQMRVRFQGIRGAKLAKVNLWMTGSAFLLWAYTVSIFLR